LGFIAAVVVRRSPSFSFKPHVAGINKRVRQKVITKVLDYIDTEGYGVCLRADIRRKVRSYTRLRVRKKDAWFSVVRNELERIANHLREKGFWPINCAFVDSEFERFTTVVSKVFGTPNIYVGKSNAVILGDVLAYVNLRERTLIKKYRSIVELLS